LEGFGRFVVGPKKPEAAFRFADGGHDIAGMRRYFRNLIDYA
jgi:hypothetical protein